MYRNILVSIDLDDPSDLDTTLRRAVELTQATPGAKLHVMTVLPPFGMSIVGSFFPKNFEHEVAEKLMARLKADVDPRLPEGMRCQHIVGEGSIYEVVLRISREIKADCIVIGAHRPDLADYLLGPNAARVVRHAACSVLVVRG
ncbi:universal stress protein [Novispirillum sp. DQ9]|uniref:universal stress protein n=1 Tax=Novispirillum sp. DQ9 TaxID=3398612 RepID=UPI003C7D15F5